MSLTETFDKLLNSLLGSKQQQSAPEDDDAEYDDNAVYIPQRTGQPQYYDAQDIYDDDDSTIYIHKADESFEDMLAEHGVTATTRFDSFWRKFIEFFVIVCEIGLCLLMGYGNGALFAGLHPWGYSGLVNVMYIFGFFLEAGAMVFLITAALALRDKNKHRAIRAGVWAVITTAISLACQIGFIFLSASQNDYDMFTNAVIRLNTPIPFQFILLLRAIAPTILAIGLAFILPEKINDIDGAIAKQEKQAEALGKLQLSRASLDQRQIAFDTATRLLVQSSKQLEYVSNTLARGHNAAVEQAHPKLTIEHVGQEAEVPISPRKVTPRAQRNAGPKPLIMPQQRQTTKSSERQQPESPLLRTEQVAERKAPDEETVKAYLRKILTRHPDITVEEVRKGAAQFGVSADLVEVCYYQVVKELQTAKPASNNNGTTTATPVQKLAPLDPSVREKVPTSRMQQQHGEVDMSDVDDEQDPLA